MWKLKETIEISQTLVFMKNPNNNSVNYWKSLFFKTDEMAGSLNPEWHSEILVEIPVSVPLEIKFQIYDTCRLDLSRTSDTMKWYIVCHLALMYSSVLVLT